MNTHLNMFASASTATELDEQYQDAVEEAALFADAAGIPLTQALANVEAAYLHRRAEINPRVLISA